MSPGLDYNPDRKGNLRLPGLRDPFISYLTSHLFTFSLTYLFTDSGQTLVSSGNRRNASGTTGCVTVRTQHESRLEERFKDGTPDQVGGPETRVVWGGVRVREGVGTEGNQEGHRNWGGRVDRLGLGVSESHPKKGRKEILIPSAN